MPPHEANSIYEFGGFSLDTANQLLLHSQRPVGLTGKDLKMLTFLVEHHDRGVGSAELVLAVWGSEGNRYIRNLPHYIARIRKVLGCDARVPKFIKTFHWKKEYRFIAPVSVVEPTSEEAQILPSSQPGTAVFDVSSHFFVPMFFGEELYSHLRIKPKTNEWIEYKEYESERGMLHLLPNGFGVWLITRSNHFGRLREFADWRRRLYEDILGDRQLLKIATESLLTSVKRGKPLERILGKPGYVFSSHVLKSTSLRNQETVKRALQVLASPSLLEVNVGRSGPKRDLDALERRILDEVTPESDLAAFGLPMIDLGYASWDSVSYLSRSGVNLEQQIVDFEIAVQALWWMCKCASEIFLSGETNEAKAANKFLPDIKRQFARLNNIAATESRSQRTMREAVLKTSRLKQMVEEVVDLHRESVK